jgi:hypothetical protein
LTLRRALRRQALRKNEKESAFLQALTKIGLKKSNESCPSSVWANLWPGHREISRHVHWKFIQSLENRRYPTVHLLNMTVALAKQSSAAFRLLP